MTKTYIQDTTTTRSLAKSYEAFNRRESVPIPGRSIEGNGKEKEENEARNNRIVSRELPEVLLSSPRPSLLPLPSPISHLALPCSHLLYNSFIYYRYQGETKNEFRCHDIKALRESAQFLLFGIRNLKAKPTRNFNPHEVRGRGLLFGKLNFSPREVRA